MVNITKLGFATRAAHAGERASRGDWMPVSTPIQPSVAFVYEGMEELDEVFGGSRTGYVYARFGSPTVAAFEAAVAALEGGEAAHAFASGMAAIHVALLAAGARAGGRVVLARDIYGATRSLVERLLAGLGVSSEVVDTCDLLSVAQALRRQRTAVVVVETISNPLVRVADLAALAALAHEHEVKLIVDNTFASPYLCNPLALGADFVVHSATKYLGGHGDVTAGVVVTSGENRRLLNEVNKLVGSTLGPFEAWLALRGLKTLPLRMRQQCSNAAMLAAWLSEHPRVASVNYPGLVSHPQHELARALFKNRGFGGMLSFELAEGGRDDAFRFMSALRLCLPATTLGDVYTLALHPATASHRGLTPEERREMGISDGLVRISAGIEDADDIIADLAQALDQV